MLLNLRNNWYICLTFDFNNLSVDIGWGNPELRSWKKISKYSLITNYGASLK